MTGSIIDVPYHMLSVLLDPYLPFTSYPASCTIVLITLALLLCAYNTPLKPGSHNKTGDRLVEADWFEPGITKESKRLKAQLRFIFNKVFAVFKLSGSCHCKRFTDDCTINNIFVLHPESTWTGIYSIKLEGTYINIRYTIIMYYFCSIIIYTFIEQMYRTQKLKN